MLDIVDSCSLLYRLELEGEISSDLKIQIKENQYTLLYLVESEQEQRNVSAESVSVWNPSNQLVRAETFAFDSLITAGSV